MGVVAGHDATRLGHGIPAHGDEDLGHHPGEHLVVHSLNTAEADDQPVTYDAAAPLDVSVGQEMRSGLLDHTAGHARACGQLGLVRGEPCVLLGVIRVVARVVGLDACGEQEPVGICWIENHDRAGELVGHSAAEHLVDGGFDAAPGDTAHVIGQNVCGHFLLSSVSQTALTARFKYLLIPQHRR